MNRARKPERAETRHSQKTAKKNENTERPEKTARSEQNTAKDIKAQQIIIRDENYQGEK